MSKKDVHSEMKKVHIVLIAIFIATLLSPASCDLINPGAVIGKIIQEAWKQVVVNSLFFHNFLPTKKTLIFQLYNFDFINIIQEQFKFHTMRVMKGLPEMRNGTTEDGN